MDITLLRRGDREEWGRSYDRLWTCAIAAARRFLFRNAFPDEDREDVALKVIAEFQKALCGGRIRRCRNEEDVERWIWGRTQWRAIGLLRKGTRENELFDRQQRDDGQDGDAGAGEGTPHRPVRPPPRLPISTEAMLDELIAWARLQPAGFSKKEEEVYRACVVKGMTTKEYAEEVGNAPGTVGRYLWTAQLKIDAVLELERQMLL